MYEEYFKILEVNQNVSMTELKSAFRRKAKLWHPDKSRSKDAHKRFILLKEAYDKVQDYVKHRPQLATHTQVRHHSNAHVQTHSRPQANSHTHTHTHSQTHTHTHSHSGAHTYARSHARETNAKHGKSNKNHKRTQSYFYKKAKTNHRSIGNIMLAAFILLIGIALIFTPLLNYSELRKQFSEYLMSSIAGVSVGAIMVIFAIFSFRN